MFIYCSANHKYDKASKRKQQFPIVLHSPSLACDTQYVGYFPYSVAYETWLTGSPHKQWGIRAKHVVQMHGDIVPGTPPAWIQPGESVEQSIY